jgi:tRNA(fMet)-specific endonuclease VapC
MHLLDTDTLTRAHAGFPGIAERVRQVGEQNIATTIITAIEILRGRHEFLLKASNGDQLLRAQRLLQSSEQLLRTLLIIPVERTSAAVFDRLRKDKKLKKMGRADLLIACIALANRATLVTRNLKHFRQLHGLQLENWID